MLSSQDRLGRSAFAATFKRARRVRLPLGQLLFVPAPLFKASVVVSKKVEKTAVGRNRLRRRYYALLGTFKKSVRGEVILVLSKEALLLSHKEAEAILRAHFLGA